MLASREVAQTRMDDPLDLFAEEVSEPANTAPTPMSNSQRDEIRLLFSELEIATAREQFETVTHLIGVRLRSVAELTSPDASSLIHRLRVRAQNQHRNSTGNSWADRDEDTWIDKL